MDYPERLRQLIEGSGLSLREIAYRARSEHGVPFDPSYISKVQSGKQAPPSEEISRAIALVCGGDPDDLIFQAYIDNAPQTIKDFVSSVHGFLKAIFDHVSRGNSMPPEALDIVRRQLDEMTPYRLLNELTSFLNFETDPVDDVAYLPGPDGKPLLQVAAPALGIDPSMPDDSMEPLIPKGAALRFVEETQYLEGDIILARTPSGVFIRRMMHMGDTLALLPMNPKYKPFTTPASDVQIIGRVKSVAHEMPRS